MSDWVNSKNCDEYIFSYIFIYTLNDNYLTLFFIYELISIYKNFNKN
jgi:hypothetical protein